MHYQKENSTLNAIQLIMLHVIIVSAPGTFNCRQKDRSTLQYYTGRSRNLQTEGRPSRSIHLPLFSPFTCPPLFPLEVGPLKPARESRERCKLPSGARGTALAENEFGAL